MGNSSSHPLSQRDSAPPSRSRPPKHTKRSIVDHPQLAVPSDPIPIPALPGQPPPPRPSPPPPHADSFADDVPDLLGEPHNSHTHRPIQYNSTRSFGGVRRGGVQGRAWQDDPPQPPPLPPKDVVMNNIVRSSIPLRLNQSRPRPEDDKDTRRVPSTSRRSDDNDGLVPTQVVWRDGGKEVILAGTFDDLEWRARKRMRYDPITGHHSITLHLPPGTYRLKFIVDDNWRCSDDMPTATDDGTGNLVNYVDVEDLSALDLGSGPDTEERQVRDDARVMKANRRRTYPVRNTGRAPNSRSPTTSRKPFHPPLLPPSESSFWRDVDSTHPDYDQEHNMEGWERGRDGVLEKWTNVTPEPLIAAAQQEEAYIAAVAAQRAARRGGAGVRGSVGSLGLGVPNIPPAPRLPRHLDKVILNAKSHHSSSSSSRSGKHRNRSGLGMTSLLAPLEGVAAGASTSAGAGPGLKVEGGASRGKSISSLMESSQADDTSVLPVPSHVVLHHLGTSAIKNGVLAVSDTTRYNKKYITTIYYKPT